MKNFKEKELIDICEELGLSEGSMKRKNAILEITQTEDVMAEKASDAWAEIKECREEAEKKTPGVLGTAQDKTAHSCIEVDRPGAQGYSYQFAAG